MSKIEVIDKIGEKEKETEPEVDETAEARVRVSEQPPNDEAQRVIRDMRILLNRAKQAACEVWASLDALERRSALAEGWISRNSLFGLRATVGAHEEAVRESQLAFNATLETLYDILRSDRDGINREARKARHKLMAKAAEEM